MNGWRYQAGYFLVDYKAEAVHHGPSFNPTGKIDFNCDMASTYFFLLPGNAEGALLKMVGLAALVSGVGLVIAAFLAIATTAI